MCVAPAPHADGDPFWDRPDRADGGLCRARGKVAVDPMTCGRRAVAGEALSARPSGDSSAGTRRPSSASIADVSGPR